MSMRWENRLDLRGLLVDVDAAAPLAIAEGLEHLRTTSAPLVPIETGRLVGSAEVHVDGDQGSLSYAGPYARYQHERLDLRHEHGQAKYLEQPMETEAETILDIVAHKLKDAL